MPKPSCSGASTRARRRSGSRDGQRTFQREIALRQIAARRARAVGGGGRARLARRCGRARARVRARGGRRVPDPVRAVSRASARGRPRGRARHGGARSDAGGARRTRRRARSAAAPRARRRSRRCRCAERSTGRGEGRGARRARRGRRRAGLARGRPGLRPPGAGDGRLARADSVSRAALRPVAARPEVELTVVYAAERWPGAPGRSTPEHRAVFLRGHARARACVACCATSIRSRPESAERSTRASPTWSSSPAGASSPSQAAIAWCRRRRVPYLLLVSSHDAVTRSALAPRRARADRAASSSARRGARSRSGTLSRASLVANGARPERVRLFANTIDVPAWQERADRLAARRARAPGRRSTLLDGDVAVLSVARLAPEKGLDTAASAPWPRPATSGSWSFSPAKGPSGPRCARSPPSSASAWCSPATFPGSASRRRTSRRTSFALLSDWEPWGVVVNEAAACGLPLVLSDQVGAAADLLVDGENGALVAAGDVAAAAAALRRYAGIPLPASRPAARSREIVAAAGATSRAWSRS